MIQSFADKDTARVFARERVRPFGPKLWIMSYEIHIPILWRRYGRSATLYWMTVEGMRPNKSMQTAGRFPFNGCHCLVRAVGALDRTRCGGDSG